MPFLTLHNRVMYEMRPFNNKRTHTLKKKTTLFINAPLTYVRNIKRLPHKANGVLRILWLSNFYVLWHKISPELEYSKNAKRAVSKILRCFFVFFVSDNIKIFPVIHWPLEDIWTNWKSAPRHCAIVVNWNELLLVGALHVSIVSFPNWSMVNNFRMMAITHLLCAHKSSPGIRPGVNKICKENTTFRVRVAF